MTIAHQKKKKGDKVFFAAVNVSYDPETKTEYAAVIERKLASCGEKQMTFVHRGYSHIFGRSTRVDNPNYFSSREAAEKWICDTYKRLFEEGKLSTTTRRFKDPILVEGVWVDYREEDLFTAVRAMAKTRNQLKGK